MSKVTKCENCIITGRVFFVKVPNLIYLKVKLTALFLNSAVFQKSESYFLHAVNSQFLNSHLTVRKNLK